MVLLLSGHQGLAHRAWQIVLIDENVLLIVNLALLEERDVSFLGEMSGFDYLPFDQTLVKREDKAIVVREYPRMKGRCCIEAVSLTSVV